MGWGSATELFDGAVDVALTFAPKIPVHLADHASGTPDSIVAAVVEKMYTYVDWNDWDTQDESKYFDPYLRDVMLNRGEIEEGDLY